MGILDFLLRRKRPIPPAVIEDKGSRDVPEGFIRLSDGTLATRQDGFFLNVIPEGHPDGEKNPLSMTDENTWNSKQPIKHVYRLAKGFDTWSCPRCNG